MQASHHDEAGYSLEYPPVTAPAPAPVLQVRPSPNPVEETTDESPLLSAIAPGLVVEVHTPRLAVPVSPTTRDAGEQSNVRRCALPCVCPIRSNAPAVNTCFEASRAPGFWRGVPVLVDVDM